MWSKYQGGFNCELLNSGKDLKVGFS